MSNIQYKLEDHQHRMDNYNRMQETPTSGGQVVVGIENHHHSMGSPILSIEESRKPFGYDGLIVSVISFLCCCPTSWLCGFFGILSSLMSYTDHRTNDAVSHRSKRNIALCCGITGIVTGVLVAVLFIALFVSGVIVAKKIVDEGQDNPFDNGNY